MKSHSYACYSVDNDIRLMSSSGGVYYHLASFVLGQNGVVYAACYDGSDVCHKRIAQLGDLAPSCGSKYIPSDLANVFHEVKCDLENGKNVLFVGTPCQCYGLQNYVGDNEKLMVVDFICHGIPSKLVWNRYIESLSLPGKKVKEINMRDKRTGWENYSFTITYDDNTVYSIPHLDSAYIKGMLNDLYLRPSCYKCSFKGIERHTDITLGDLWGVTDLYPEIDANNGVSFLTTHSPKGEMVFNNIKYQLKYMDVDAAKCAVVNECMISSVPLTKDRDAFFSMFYEGKEIDTIVSKLTQQSIKSKVLNKIKKYIYKLG